MNRTQENDCYRRFRATRDPRLLARLFDATAPELLRVASHLTGGDRDATQDAVQATFLTAIEDADGYDASRDVRPWLLGILANHVRKERRRVARQRADAAAGADLVAAESPVTTAALRELDAATTEAMQQLPSPFREAIVLHLQHGLSAREIGEALGRPAGTVRTQIVRGLDRLRALLPAGFAAGVLGVSLVPATALAAVRRSVLASVPAHAVVAGSSSWFLTGWRLWTMMAAGVLAVVFSILSGAWSHEPRPVGGAEAEVAREVAPERAAPPQRSRLPVAQRQAEPPAAEGAQAEAPPANTVRVTLTVTYADGTPAAGQWVGFDRDRALVTHRADEQGVVPLDLEWPGLYTIYALGTNDNVSVFWPEFARRPAPEQHRLVIQPGLTLDVGVVDEGGAPIAGAFVESNSGAQPVTMLSPIGRTGADGHLRRRDLDRNGQLRVWAPGYLPSDIVGFDAPLGETCEREVTLRRAKHVVRGVVRGPDGEPIAGAQLGLVQLTARPLEPQFARSDEQGRFVLDTLHAARHVLVGMHRGEALLRGAVRFEADDEVIELRLTTGARIEGVLRDANGELLANVHVVARVRPEAVHSLPFLETWAKTGADGAFALTSLVACTYELESENVPSQLVTVRDGDVLRQDLQRLALQPVALRLVDAAGAPLANWRITVLPPGSDYPDAGTSTGADGRPVEPSGRGWHFPAGSSYRIAAFPPLPGAVDFRDGYAPLPALITPPLLVGTEHVVRVSDVAQQLHTIRGELVDEAGEPIRDGKVRLIGALGQVFGQSFDVDERGAFSFENEPSGRYHAWLQRAGRPTFVLGAIDARTEGDASFGRVVVPGTGRVVVDVGRADVQGLTMQLVSPSGRAHRLRRGDDGLWRTGTLYRDDYELRGWTRRQWVAPKNVRLDRDELVVDATLVAHESTRVVVELPFDHPRNSGSWSGKVQALRDGRVLCEHRVNRAFYGTFEDRMEFDVPLPPGSVQVRVEGWNGRAGRAPLRVPNAGGGSVRVLLQ